MNYMETPAPYTSFPDYRIKRTARPCPNPVALELLCHAQLPSTRTGVPPGHHFRMAVELLYNKQHKTAHFQWNPWAEDQLELAAGFLVEPENNPKPGEWAHYCAVSGCASSGKTDFWSMWALQNWHADPMNTLVIVCSTTIKGAEGRIWGRMVRYFQAIEGARYRIHHLGIQWPEFNFCWPGKIVAHEHCIRTIGPDGKIKPKDCGIHLLALDRKKDLEKIGNYIGLKNQRVFLIIDEMPDIGEAIMHAGFSNLSKNPRFQMVGLGNFKSVYDAFGRFTEPVEGWGAVHVDMPRWKTKHGECLHLDGMKSPNIVGGKSPWKGLYSPKDLKSDQEKYGAQSSFFWRMCRSFPNLSGEVDKVFSEADFMRGRAHEQPTWLGDPVKLAALDPAFTNGGDRAIMFFGKYGQVVGGSWVLYFDHWEHLSDDATNKQDAFDLQIAKAFCRRIKEEKIAWRNSALDSTGAGISFLSLVKEISGHGDVVGVAFGGKASMLPAGPDTTDTAQDRYANRVTELWFVGREWCRAGKWRGLDTATAQEFCSRKYETIKSPTGTTVRVEPKTDMKERGLPSPDIADAACVLQELVRQNFGELGSRMKDGKTDWDRAMDDAEAIYEGEFINN